MSQEKLYNLEILPRYCEDPEISRMTLFYLDNLHTLKIFSKPTLEHPEGTEVRTIKKQRFADIARILEAILMQ